MEHSPEETLRIAQSRSEPLVLAQVRHWKSESCPIETTEVALLLIFRNLPNLSPKIALG